MPTKRALGFIGKELLNSNTIENQNLEIYKPVCHSIISFYANSYNPISFKTNSRLYSCSSSKEKKSWWF